MSPRFFISLKKWPLAVQKALSILNETSLDGETRIVDFQFGPPSRGKLPLRLFIDGRRALQCEFCDADSSFLQDLREWMEHCLVLDQEGTLHPELLTLNVERIVLSFVLIHVGWEDDRTGARPISFFAVVGSDSQEPLACCFCDTLDTISGLYQALWDCLLRYRARFDSDHFWHDVKRLDRLNPRSTSDRMAEQLRSRKIERLSISRRKPQSPPL